MLRTLAFLGVAAVAASQLKKSGALDRFSESLKTRADDLRKYAEDKRSEYRSPSTTSRPQTARVPNGSAPAV